MTEAHANLKKKKTSCNTTLRHNIVMQFDLLASSIFFHLFTIIFIIKVHMGCSALLHSAHVPPAFYHCMN